MTSFLRDLTIYAAIVWGAVLIAWYGSWYIAEVVYTLLQVIP